MFKKVSFLFVVICLFTACSRDGALLTSNSQDPSALDNVGQIMGKEQCLQSFAQILSKAVTANDSVRSFLKDEALQKIDNGYDIFYPIAKDKKIGKRTFGEILSDYAGTGDVMRRIEDSVPLLNIHIPEIGTLKVSNLDTSDKEITVLYNNKFYLDGYAVGSLPESDVPGFYTFVVCENNKIRKKESLTRAISENSLNAEYEYVDRVFNPIYTNGKMNSATRAVLHDTPNPKFDERGLVPARDIDPLVLQAYNHAGNQKRATRYLAYYNLNNVSDTPVAMRADVRDCLFRFKIAADAFSRYKRIAEGNGNSLFYGGTTNKKHELSREDAINRLLTGNAFCFFFEIEGRIKGNIVASESMKVYVTPEKIFDLGINEQRKHGTMFRHQSFTYTVKENDIKTKWFYPLENGHDTRLDKWDISTDPIEKRIVVYLVNPDKGDTKHITETYTVQYISGGEVGLNVSIPIKMITLGINGKLNSSNTISKQVTTQYTITQNDEKIDEFQFDYFDDYPIEGITTDGYILPIRKGKGVIETSILPVSNYFYNVVHQRNN